MKALKKHPNIIELIDVIDDERKDKKYIVLELANGCNLQELLLSAPDSVRVPRGGVLFFLLLVLLHVEEPWLLGFALRWWRCRWARARGLL